MESISKCSSVCVCVGKLVFCYSPRLLSNELQGCWSFAVIFSCSGVIEVFWLHRRKDR